MGLSQKRREKIRAEGMLAFKIAGGGLLVVLILVYLGQAASHKKAKTQVEHLAPIEKTTQTTLKETFSYIQENQCYTDAKKIIIKGVGHGRGRTADRAGYEYRVDQDQYDLAYLRFLYSAKISKEGLPYSKLYGVKDGVTYHCKNGDYNIVTPLIFDNFLFGNLSTRELHDLRKIAINKPLNHFLQTEEL